MNWFEMFSSNNTHFYKVADWLLNNYIFLWFDSDFKNMKR